MRLVLSIAGDTQLDRELLRFAGRTDDMTPVLTDLADNFLTLERRQFTGEGTYSGGWAALAPATVRRRGSAHPILDEHGDLRRSLTEVGAKNAIRSITTDTLEVGSSDPKVAYHQHGTRRMPQRRPVELSEEARRDWVKRIQSYLIGNSP